MKKDISLDDFFATCQSVPYKKGQAILKEGEISKDVYCIKQGYVKVFSISPQGVESVRLIYKPVKCFLYGEYF